MLRAFTERRDSGQATPTQEKEKAKTWVASSSNQNAGPKPKSNHKRKASAKPKVTFKSQMSGASGSKTRTTTAAKQTTPADTNTTPVSKRHKALASLLVSFLATSSVAVDYDAADEKTIESANKASSTPLPPPPPKAHRRSTSGVKPSEIRKTRWKRFKYEMGLKMKSGQKGKQRQPSVQATDVELADMRSNGREGEGQAAKRVGTA
ncbi:hypothetical protein CC86DRAFT_167573 [Ophiobolus disseminans]|uniref:Uncharacterized protein n=1 Tax=Ophiobolus disseminans TaxID=1469910 RepID=A0A6A7ADL1_9PLEO|nr:hypothetical protein CC86DRAFT_167573 [Ophiobolus disseminans]